MIVPKLPQLRKEDYPEAQSWLARLFIPLNLYNSQVVACLQNLTFGQNIVGQINTFTIQTSATYTSGDFPETFYTWNYSQQAQPQGVTIQMVRNQTTQAVITQPIGVPDWIPTDRGVQIRYIAGLDNSTKYQVRVLTI